MYFFKLCTIWKSRIIPVCVERWRPQQPCRLLLPPESSPVWPGHACQKHYFIHKILRLNWEDREKNRWEGREERKLPVVMLGVREGRTPSKRWLAEKRIRRKWERERTKEDIDRQTDNFNNMHLNWYIICIYCRWSLSYKPCQHFLIKKTLQKKLWFYGKPAKHKILILVSFSDSGFTQTYSWV